MLSSEVDVKKKLRRLWNPMEVRWAEIHSDEVSYFWSIIPPKVQPYLITIFVFILGISLKGKYL